MAEETCIGLLSPFFVPIPAYERPAAELGVKLAVVTPSRIDWQREEVEGLVWDGSSWQQQILPIPKAFYNRFYGPKPKVVNRLELLLGKNKVFNHVTRFDKLEVHNALSATELQEYLPETAAYRPERLLEVLDSRGQVILKPRRGRLGVGIYLIRKKGKRFQIHLGTKSPIMSFSSQQELAAWLEDAFDGGWLIQEFIPLAKVDGRPFDVRILVQKDGSGAWQPSGGLSRSAFRHSYITNVNHALRPADQVLDRAFPGQKLLPQLEAISLQAAEFLEEAAGSLGEISVDFGLESSGTIWIIELNAKPMKSLFRSIGGESLLKTVYKRPLEYALHLSKGDG